MHRNRLLLLAVALGAAAIVVVVLVVAGGGASSPSTTTTTAAAPAAAASMFAGIPQHGDTLGRPGAPVSLIVYEDPQCPFCRQWNIDTLPTVVRDYVRTGRVKLVYRGIVVIGGNSVAGLRAIYAAGNQNKLWNMAEAMYERQGGENSGWITLAVIRDAAREIKANPAKIVADADSKSVTAALTQTAKEAASLGINGTPIFATQKPLGTLQQLRVAGLEPSDFTPALDAALR
ncbi:MAG: DsbA family protein [Gaiellaceae bacterium]